MSATIKERPILFSGAMVKRILSGDKTMTRRVVKPQPVEDETYTGGWVINTKKASTSVWSINQKLPSYQNVCPYGKVGDRLWVKEVWRPEVAHSHAMNTCDCGDINITYSADGVSIFFEDSKIPNDWTIPKAADIGNVTPLFMPRFASRITLEITDVRVERLCEIREADAQAEGIVSIPRSLTQHGRMDGYGIEGTPPEDAQTTRVNAFAVLWDKINEAKYPWDSNVFVWVVSFKRIKP